MAKQEKNGNLEQPSVLAFERKMDPSDALFHAVCWSDSEGAGTPVVIREKSVRGTISNRLKGSAADPAKVDAAIQSPNLQTVDVAALPMDKDTLKVTFTLRILSGVGTPSACNQAEYQTKLSEVVTAYREEHGFGELALRYAQNIANGRFLWRNRLASEEVRVVVRHLVEGEAASTWEFKASSISLRDFRADKPELMSLAHVLETALSKAGGYALLEVTAFARMGFGQEVYPSQELVLDKSKGKKSKTLYSVEGVAAMHSQKIGNALRTIDTWYPEAEENGPIAVEPYGSVTSQGKAYRQPKSKKDFYSLLDGWLLKDVKPEKEQQHFVMAVLIRGGVFGEASKEKE
ncbi:type I-F CRISPR-associated protein Csy3 [Mailhella sp.]